MSADDYNQNLKPAKRVKYPDDENGCPHCARYGTERVYMCENALSLFYNFLKQNDKLAQCKRCNDISTSVLLDKTCFCKKSLKGLCNNCRQGCSVCNEYTCDSCFNKTEMKCRVCTGEIELPDDFWS